MPYSAQVFRVMIASPGDVAKERQLVREVIQEWNAVHSQDRAIVLMPVGWETHASPSMEGRAQEIINRQVLRDADLLIAVFWTRLGSPTGSAPSGTVEEIEEHLSGGKPAMIYFSSQPVRPDSVNAAQYESLKEFKEKCKSRGLIEEYDDLTQFKDKLSRHLAQTVIRKLAPTARERASIPYAISLEAPPEESTPAISDSAKELLLEASKASDGTILWIRTMGGDQIQTNGRGFISESTPRVVAKWTGAVRELESVGLIEDLTHDREVFTVTNEGYAVADKLGLR